MARVDTHRDLHVYQNAFKAAIDIFHLSKQFPFEERFALTDQIRRSSRSVCANLAEAWRKRRYKAAFIAKLSDCESEACETLVHLEFCRECEYLNEEETKALIASYDRIIAQLITIINQADKWTLKQ